MRSTRHYLLMTTAAALCAAPMLAFGQANTGGSSMQPQATQTTPQQGSTSGMPAARGSATTGSDTGMAPNTSGTNAPGAATSQTDRIRRNEGNTTGQDARPGAASSTDGTPGNPPSTATQRAADGVTGNRTDPDGTGNNPPGTAAGRALDRATGGATTGQTMGNTPATSGGTANTRDGTPGNPPSTATGRAADAVTGTRTDPDGTGNNPPGTALGRALGTSPGNTAGTAATATGAAATGATAGAMAVDSARMQGGRRASRVIGSTVYNENNESIGEVDDIIIPAGTTQPVAVISVGGFLGIGARLVAVPYERLQHAGDRDRWVLPGATKDSLQSLPAHTYEDGNRRG